VDLTDGRPIGQCQVSRLDQRSPKPHQYGLSDAQGTPANCGVELCIIEGHTQPPAPSELSAPGVVPIPPPDLSAPGVVPIHHAGMPSTASPFGHEVTIHLLRLLDVPRRQATSRYIVRLSEQSGGELGYVETEGHPGNGEETVEFGHRGTLRLHTISPLLKVHVSWSDGQVLGSCQIHRLDPRSARPSAYCLIDAHGQSANCGIELQVSEIAHPPQENFSRNVSGMPPEDVFSRHISNASLQPPVAVGPTPMSRLASGTSGAMVTVHNMAPSAVSVAGFAPQIPPHVFGPPFLHGQPLFGPTVVPSDAAWVAPSLSRDPLGLFPHVSSYEYKGHEASELWLKTPDMPTAGLHLASGTDLEAEAWRAPVLALHDQPCSEDYFPDMDLSLLKPANQKGPTVKPVNGTMTTKRRKEGLPELSVDRWVQEPPPRPKPQPKQMSKPLTSAVQPLALTNGVAQAAPRSTVDVRRQKQQGKLKVERELVRPEEAREIEQHGNNPAVALVDPALQPEQFEAQVIGCLELGEEIGTEKSVWARSPSGEVQCIDAWDEHSLIEPFETEELRVGVARMRGQRGTRDPLPAQDNFSMTRVSADISVFVVCDGHGPFGHVAAFRVVQSLPKLIADALSADSTARRLPEHCLLKAFERANADLLTFSAHQNLDLGKSGTACTVALRICGDVQVAWLGDTRAMVATVTKDRQKVDLMSPTHTTADNKEHQRVRSQGAILRAVPSGTGPLRIFAQGERGPGLLVTRALGDTSATILGVAWQPDIRKMSFSSTPGLVVLGSGGLWDMLDDGTGNLPLRLMLEDGELWECGPGSAARCLVENAQQQWRQFADALCDDTTAIALHWTRPAPSVRSAIPHVRPALAPVQEQPKLLPTHTLSHEEIQQLQSDSQLAGQVAPSASGSAGIGAEGPLISSHPSQSRGVVSPEEYLAWRAQHKPEQSPPVVAGASLHMSSVAAPSATSLESDALWQQHSRLKPTTTEELQKPDGGWQEEMERLCGSPAIAEPDRGLLPSSFTAQIISRLQIGGSTTADLPVWFRTENGLSEPLDFAAAVRRFEDLSGRGSAVQVAAQCRRGQHANGGRPPANQDSFSMTTTRDDRALYVVCDGHGPLGHLVAFRVAQSLPRLILAALEYEQTLAENVIAKAFEAANVDLTQFAANWDLDISASGTAVTLALRQRDVVHVAWLGDARVLVATVVGDDSRVDLMAKSHTPAEPAELQRLTRQGAEIGREQRFMGQRQESIRVYKQTNTGDPVGLSVSRALGDTAFSSIGVIGHPDLAKTSFASTPGLILLASGGAWEFLGDGEAVVENLLRDGQLGRRGPQHALSCLCDIAQDRWHCQEPGCFEDITGLLLHWPSEDDYQVPSFAAPVQSAAPSVMPSQPVTMAKVLHSEPQRFLQAQPSVSSQQVQVQETWTARVIQ